MGDGARGFLVRILVIGLAAGGVLLGYSLLAGASRPSDAPSTGGGLLGQVARADAVRAQSLLIRGSVAMESYYAERGTFTGVEAVLPAVEPTVAWTTAPFASSSGDAVTVTVAPGGVAYSLSTLTPAGTTIGYSRDAAGVVSRTCGPGCAW
jgi:hypothetical protein